jgi:hypothetical protein
MTYSYAANGSCSIQFLHKIHVCRFQLFAITHGNNGHFTASIKWTNGVRPATLYHYDGMKNVPLSNDLIIPHDDTVKQHMLERNYSISRIIYLRQ